MKNLSFPTEGVKSGSDLNTLLKQFDPRCHGGEVMAFPPVGREFGSAEYLQIEGDLRADESKSSVCLSPHATPDA